MKTIEEIKEVAEREIDALFGSGETLGQECFVAGANWMRKELTKWNDPDEELPEYYKVVEIKYRISGLSRISIAWISAGDAGGYLWTIDGTDVLVNAKHVVGWRPIHE